jgi:putative ABC transport system permease protein
MPGYFATMKTPLLRGRDFSNSDTLESQRVVIVNETLARRHWPGEEAVGKRIAAGRDPRWLTVAGVVRDVKQSDWQANPRDEIYFPFSQSSDYLANPARHYSFMSIVVRVDRDPAAAAASVRRAVESVDPNVLISNLISMERAVANNLWRPRLSLLLLGAFGVVALALAVTGIYGVISHSVSQRTHEIGIRIALGATRREVLADSIVRGLPPVAIGIGAGIVMALSMTRLMTAMLYGVKPTDPLTFAATAALMLASGILAALWPAFRASRVDPMIALRHN